MEFGHMESLSYICGMKLFNRHTHPLSNAVMKITKDKTYPFAQEKTSCTNGYCKVTKVRKMDNKCLVDVEVILTRDENPKFHKTEEGRIKSREASIRYDIKGSELRTYLKIVGISEFKVGKIKIV